MLGMANGCAEGKVTDYRATHAIVESLRRICRGLEKLKYELEIVGDVDEAVRVVRTLQSDMIFLTEQMTPTDEAKPFKAGQRVARSALHAKDARLARSPVSRLRLLAAYGLIFAAGALSVLTIQYSSGTIEAAFSRE